jgi:hypothetical protein
MPKKIEFTCLDRMIEKNCPVLPASKFLPDWYKKLPMRPEGVSKCPVARLFESYTKPQSTIKACPPVFDYMNSGYIIPWINQVVFKKTIAEETENIKGFDFFCAFQDYISWHYPSQMPHLKTYFFKIKPYWNIKTPKGYSCMFFQPFYHFEDRYSILPAIVDTDTYHTPNFIGYLLKDQFTVNPNEPLICVLPFKRDDFNSILKTESSNKSSIFDLFINNKYKLFAWEKKKFN